MGMHHRSYIQRRKLFVGTMIAIAVAVFVLGTVVALQKPDQPALPSPPLKNMAAEHGIEIGNFAIRTRIYEKPYGDILTSQFNLALIDNTPNWYFTDGGLRPSADTYSFAQMDEIVNFAEQHNMHIQAHHLLWGDDKWLPDWLKNGNYSPAQLDNLIQQHINTVAGRYAGRIHEWTVVNEAFSRGQHAYGLNDWWADHAGSKEYIERAFYWAREADPMAKLILNDFGNESINAISNEMYDYVAAAKTRGVPIDGIGMQMHIDGTHPPTKDEVISNMRRFGDLGVGVYVTEFDVNMNDVRADPADKDQIQAAIYSEMARACIESNVCKSFSILGISDEETWYNYIGLTDPRPLPFDKSYKPKPAFYALRDAFSY